jgi:hypothetical protein
MVEKEITKKWLVLLIVLVVLSLVMDLLSLNVLYDINNRTELKGELATKPPKDDIKACIEGCMEGAQHDCVDICSQGTNTECSCCELIVEETCRTNCGKSSRRLPRKCIL